MKKIYQTDPWLEPYRDAIEARHARILAARDRLMAFAGAKERLADAAVNHLYYGLHREKECWVFREWAPSATRICVIGTFNNWKRTAAWELQPVGNGNWELSVPLMFLRHGELYKLWIEWPGGRGRAASGLRYACRTGS